MRIGIAYDLKSSWNFYDGGTPPSYPPGDASGPEDILEEYDSEETVAAIGEAIAAAGHELQRLEGGRRFLERVLEVAPDLVFNIAEGRPGTRSREAQVPAVCELLGVPYTHSDPLTLALTLDKALAKRVVASHGIATPAFALIDHPDDLGRLPLPMFPVMAKLDWEGSSMGVRRTSRADTMAELEERVRWLFSAYGNQPILVEEFCSGAEFTVGVTGNGASARVLGVMEIAPRTGSQTAVRDFIYSLEVKRNFRNEVEYHCPPRSVPEHVSRAVAATALGAYRALGCRDVARVDVRLSGDGVTPKFLEVNPLPGLNPKTGDLPILASRIGLSYEELIAAVVDGALERLGACVRA